MTDAASFPALGTTATVVVCDEADLEDARRILGNKLNAFDAACSRFRPDSELSRANARAGERVEVGPLFARAIAVALDAAAATDGVVTPTLGAALAACGYDRTFRLVRARGTWQLRAAAAESAPWRAVELDERGDGSTLYVPPGVELDLGATAKALAADRAAAEIAGRTGRGVLVSLGGDIAVAGPPPAGGWIVRIADDHTAPLSAIGPIVSLERGGLATSSTAVRRWPTDRGEAHHVIDPRTSLPADTPWRTVSVTAGTCVEANVASLVALVLGEAAPAWLRTRGLHARLVRTSGAVVYAGAWPVDALTA